MLCFALSFEPLEEVITAMEQKRQKALQLVANTLRCLAADEVQAAKSGHPGVALSLADVMAVLWLYFLKVDGSAPTWADRDRFVMSGGHGSSLLYALEQSLVQLHPLQP